MAIRLRGLVIFVAGLILSLGAVYAIAHWNLRGRGAAGGLALPFVAMVYGLAELVAGRPFGEINAWFASLPALARVPLGCIGVPAALALCGVIVIGAYRRVATFAAGGVHVYVDNGTAKPLQVSLDGAKPVAVPASAVLAFEAAAGPHRVVVRDGDRVVYDAQKDLPEADRPRKLLLNPDRQHRYVVQTVYYGNDPGSGFEFPFTTDYDINRALLRVQLAEPDPWVPGWFDAVFAEAPPVSIAKDPSAPTRSRLCSLAAEDHAVLSAAIREANRKPPHPVAPAPALMSALAHAQGACR